MQLGQLAVRLLRVRHEELVHDPFAQHLAHHMSQQALHDEPKPRVVEPSRVERLEERRLARVLEVLIQCLGERDEGEVGAEFGAWRVRRGGSHLVAERVGGPAVDAALETARAVFYGELGEGRKGYRSATNEYPGDLELTSSTVDPPPPEEPPTTDALVASPPSRREMCFRRTAFCFSCSSI